MEDLNIPTLRTVDGGGLGALCGFAIGLNGMALLFSRSLAIWLAPKTINACILDANT